MKPYYPYKETNVDIQHLSHFFLWGQNKVTIVPHKNYLTIWLLVIDRA